MVKSKLASYAQMTGTLSSRQLPAEAFNCCIGPFRCETQFHRAGRIILPEC
jgi:hypothetical protein